MANRQYPWSEYLSRGAVLTAESSAANAFSPVVAMVGLAFEARIAAGEGVVVICRGTGCGLSGALQRALRAGCRSIISFGVAGGLAPDLRAGDVVVASAVRDSHTIRATDPIWSQRLLGAVPDGRHALIIGVDSPVLHPNAKRELYVRTGALAVDMESHLVAQAAHTYNLTFAAVRVVVDPVHREVPEAAWMSVGPAGNAEISPLLREILAHPSQLSAFIRIVFDGYRARSALLRMRRIAGRNFGLPEQVDSTPFYGGFAPK